MQIYTEARSSAGERCPDAAEVRGSKPLVPKNVSYFRRTMGYMKVVVIV